MCPTQVMFVRNVSLAKWAPGGMGHASEPSHSDGVMLRGSGWCHCVLTARSVPRGTILVNAVDATSSSDSCVAALAKETQPASEHTSHS